MLHSNDQVVIIVRQDSGGITARECDVNYGFSLFLFGEPCGHDVRSQHMPDVFPPGGIRASSTGKTPTMVLILECGAL